MTRYTTTGRDSWSARSGYRYQSPPHLRLERPAGEPGILRGTLIIALPIVAVWLAVVMLSPAASEAQPPASAQPSPAVEAGTGEGGTE